MKTKLLLILMLSYIGSRLMAQDTITHLIISEARFDTTAHAYIELTNMGDSTLHLNQFELGVVHPGDPRIDETDLNKWFQIGTDAWFMLPDTTLEPGESIVFTRAGMSASGSTGEVSHGSDCWYIRHHVTFWSGDPVPVLLKDSIVIDQVGGVFAGPDGQLTLGAKDVAGVAGATGNSIVVRKFSVNHGNIDFETGRGLDPIESEWIVIPVQDYSGDLFWTVGNHVNANLGTETLISSTIIINRADSTLTVPWGIRRDDPIMREFTGKPGLSWHYDYVASYEDSVYLSVRTGDVLTLYACGDVVETIPFTIIALDPAADENRVIPKRTVNTHGFFAGQEALFEVTENVPGMDTIRGNVLYANSSATRVDTLLKYLQIAANAHWEIRFVDGYERINVKNGDIMKVISESGLVKEYFIKVTGTYIEYDAFVTSEVYMINQDEYYIAINLTTADSISVGEFLSNLIPAPGASLKVKDAQGFERTGNVINGDWLVVTSADGFKVIHYQIEVFFPHTVITTESNTIRLFPNPTSGKFSLSGIPVQSRVVIKSLSGRNVLETDVSGETTQLSLENQPAGIYFVLITYNSDTVCFKLMVK